MMMPPKETLVLPQGEAITWNEFDTGWYRRFHCQGRDVQDALEEYLTVGQASGHSPNMFFDEAWYRRRNPDVAEAVQAGHFSSGFDHYCRAGFRTRSPHWLFDVSYYEAGSPDLTADSLTAAGS
jgi:O-antigen biosynthesis protein